jgi:hypothetical protein
MNGKNHGYILIQRISSVIKDILQMAKLNKQQLLCKFIYSKPNCLK